MADAHSEFLRGSEGFRETSLALLGVHISRIDSFAVRIAILPNEAGKISEPEITLGLLTGTIYLDHHHFWNIRFVFSPRCVPVGTWLLRGEGKSIRGPMENEWGNGMYWDRDLCGQ